MLRLSQPPIDRGASLSVPVECERTGVCSYNYIAIYQFTVHAQVVCPA
jgi:hypothetical protein